MCNCSSRCRNSSDKARDVRTEGMTTHMPGPAWARRHLCFTTWSDPENIDDGTTEKVQSFSHDYAALFAEIGWKPLLNIGMTYGENPAEDRNRLWFLEKSCN